MDETSLRSTAAMQLKFLTQLHAHDCARNDAIELLTGSKDVRRAGKYHRETVRGKVCAQAHVRRRARNCIRCAGVERLLLANQAFDAAVDLRRGHMNVLSEEVEAA